MQFQSDFFSSVWMLWRLKSDFKQSFTQKTLLTLQGIYEWKLLLA